MSSYLYNMKRKQIEVTCSNPNCGKQFLKDKSEIDRNLKIGRKNYCSRSCVGKVHSEHLLNYVDLYKDNLINFSDNKRDKYTGFRRYMAKAKSRDKECNITLDDLLEQWVKQNGICIYSGVKLNHPQKKGSSITTASLDRIDSKKGYIKDNIQFISIACNYAKNNMTHEDMLTFCKLISNFNKD
jgi:hypothetical protein